MSENKQIIPVEIIENRIHVMRGQKIMFDQDLANLYGVTTKVLNQAVSRNKDRFPEDFMFRLNDKEYEILKSQTVTSSWGGRRYPPNAFTEAGIAMLSSVLRSKKAIQVNIAIIRTFIHLREMLATHKDLADKIEAHDQQIAYLFELVNGLLQPPEPSKNNPIGFEHPKKD